MLRKWTTSFVVRLTLESGHDRYFMTCERIQDAVDPAKLEAILLENSRRFAIGGRAASAHLCGSLQDASKEPYFYEALFQFGQTKIPFGDGYESWRESMDEQMRNGKLLYYLGSA
jgi:hypothetical protein